MLTDIKIAQQANMKPISVVANKLNIAEQYVEHYGKYKAKISDELWKTIKDRPDGKLILVTAINPTPAGEGKTTTTVGLGQAMGRLGKNAAIALREPSMGPVMGIKGGAAGGGYAQVVPMEDINLHFTGDMHAITAANNLLSATIDNHLQQGNKLGIDPRQVMWKRVMDMNDRALRNVIVGLGGKINGVPREDSFMITVASEIMAILCLSTDLMDLKKRLGNIIIGYNYDNNPVTTRDLKVDGAMTVLLKDAIKPNLVQTLENTPCFMHGGPFANIAHGCNSIMATKTALKLADYVITEAGFGADLGAEKFFDIKCRYGNLKPDAVVIVATVRALKYNGGASKGQLTLENLEALKRGIVNLEKHIENIKKFNLPIVVAINHFNTDTEEEIEYVKDFCKSLNVECSMSKVFEQGGEGGIELAQKVMDVMDTIPSKFKYLYDEKIPIKDKIKTIVTEIYGGKDVVYSKQAEKMIKRLEEIGYGQLPICMAKTQYSLSDDPSLLGRPKDFIVTVKEIRVSAGAGFIVALTGNIMTMPGLPKEPSAEKIDIDENGKVAGLF